MDNTREDRIPAEATQLWLIEPNAASDDPRWQGRSIWQLIVAAPSAAYARLEAERWMMRERGATRPTDQSLMDCAGFVDEALYFSWPLPEGVGPSRAEFTDSSVMLLAGPMQSKARA